MPKAYSLNSPQSSITLPDRCNSGKCPEVPQTDRPLASAARVTRTSEDHEADSECDGNEALNPRPIDGNHDGQRSSDCQQGLELTIRI